MELDFVTIALIVLITLLVLFILIRRNQKDKKKFEQDTIQSETKPERQGRDESL